MTKEPKQLKWFLCKGPNKFTALVAAFNRGHAATQLGKIMERKGLTLSMDYKIVGLDPDSNKKGQVFVLSD